MAWRPRRSDAPANKIPTGCCHDNVPEPFPGVAILRCGIRDGDYDFPPFLLWESINLSRLDDFYLGLLGYTVPLPYNTVIIITDNNPGNKLLWTVQSLNWWRKSQFVLSPLTKPRKKKKEEEKTKASLGRTDRHISSEMDSSTWDRDKSRDTSNGNPFSRQQRTVRVGAAAWRARPVYQLVAPANRRGVSDWGALQWRTHNF